MGLKEFFLEYKQDQIPFSFLSCEIKKVVINHDLKDIRESFLGVFEPDFGEMALLRDLTILGFFDLVLEIEDKVQIDSLDIDTAVTYVICHIVAGTKQSHSLFEYITSRSDYEKKIFDSEFIEAFAGLKDSERDRLRDIYFPDYEFKILS